MKELKFVLYARKSTESEDKQVQSIKDQIENMTELAEKRGLEIVKVLRESRSAKTPHQRPEFAKMLAMIEDGKADAVLCWQLNRLSRNPTESGMLQQLLQDEKIQCIQTIDRAYLPDDNAIVFSVEAGMSNQFIRDLMKNVRRGMRSKAEKGWLPGVPAVGYKNDRENKIIVIDEQRFHIVRKMWDMMLTGTYTVAQISDIAEKEFGLTTIRRKKRGGKPLSYSCVYNMFHNPFYAGILTYGGEQIPGKHKAMVSEEEFDKVQQQINKNHAARPNKRSELIATFRGLLRCGECGCSITPSHVVKRQKNGVVREYDYYHCSLRKKNYKCSQHDYMSEEDLADQIKSAVSKYTISPRFYEIAVQALQEMDEHEIVQQVQISESQNKAITAKEKEIRELGRMRYRGECPDDDFYRSEKKKLEDELKDLVKARSKAEAKAKDWRVEADETFSFARYAKERFDGDDLEKKREVLVKLGKNLNILDGKLYFTPSKYLVRIEEAYPVLEERMERVGTLPQQMKKEAEASIISDWYTRQDLNLRPLAPQANALSS